LTFSLKIGPNRPKQCLHTRAFHFKKVENILPNCGQNRLKMVITTSVPDLDADEDALQPDAVAGAGGLAAGAAAALNQDQFSAALANLNLVPHLRLMSFMRRATQN
jgi:hypothetical protein